MELTGGAANRTMGGDEKSECMREEAGSGCSVRVDLPTQRCWALHDEMAASSDQEGVVGDFLGHFATRIISIPIWLFRHNDGLGLKRGNYFIDYI